MIVVDVAIGNYSMMMLDGWIVATLPMMIGDDDDRPPMNNEDNWNYLNIRYRMMILNVMVWYNQYWYSHPRDGLQRQLNQSWSSTSSSSSSSSDMMTTMMRKDTNSGSCWRYWCWWWWQSLSSYSYSFHYQYQPSYNHYCCYYYMYHH